MIYKWELDKKANKYCVNIFSSESGKNLIDIFYDLENIESKIYSLSFPDFIWQNLKNKESFDCIFFEKVPYSIGDNSSKWRLNPRINDIDYIKWFRDNDAAIKRSSYYSNEFSELLIKLIRELSLQSFK